MLNDVVGSALDNVFNAVLNEALENVFNAVLNEALENARVRIVLRRIKLTVAYDGTGYSGWQYQPEKNTIEGVLNGELSRLLNEEIKVIGASRTDAGVHAEGAVCVFDTSSRIPGEKFSYALNQSLPEDIVIRKSEEVAPDFHPRKVPTKKTYRYSIWHDEFPQPTNSRYTHWVYTDLDVEAMQEAAGYFEGEHDFVGFCSANTQAETTVRTIYNMHVRVGGFENAVGKVDFENVVGEAGFENVVGEAGIENVVGDVGRFANSGRRNYNGRIDIYVTGNGFLYNMVRIIAGTLIEVGQGKIKPSEIPGIIESGDRQLAGNTAPAKGLTLMKYEMN